MKLRFQLRMQPLTVLPANTKTDAAMIRKFTNSKNEQIEEAIQCCLKNNA